MANISDLESDIKLEALKNAFEYLKAKTLVQDKKNRKNMATAKAVIIRANSSERVLKECKHKIGEKFFNQVKEDTPFYKLKKKIDDFKKYFPTIKTLVNNKVKESIMSLDRKLKSNEEVNVKLMWKYRDLKEEYEYLEEELKQAQQDRDNFVKKNEELRKENRQLKKEL